MAETKTLAASVRSGTGKGAARSVRREGRIPAVIYGGGDAPQPISLDRKTATQLIYAGHFLTTIFELDVDGRKERVIPRDYQRMLACISRAHDQGLTGDEAIMVAFEENARDTARVGGN